MYTNQYSTPGISEDIKQMEQLNTNQFVYTMPCIDPHNLVPVYYNPYKQPLQDDLQDDMEIPLMSHNNIIHNDIIDNHAAWGCTSMTMFLAAIGIYI